MSYLSMIINNRVFK